MAEPREQAAQRLIGMMAMLPGAHQSMNRSNAKDFAIQALTDTAVDLLVKIDELKTKIEMQQGLFNAAMDRCEKAEARVMELESERLRFYRADGTFEVLASPEEVTKRRVECAARIEELSANWAIAEKRLTQIAFLDPERASCRDAIEISITGCD